MAKVSVEIEPTQTQTLFGFFWLQYKRGGCVCLCELIREREEKKNIESDYEQ